MNVSLTETIYLREYPQNVYLLAHTFSHKNLCDINTLIQSLKDNIRYILNAPRYLQLSRQTKASSLDFCLNGESCKLNTVIGSTAVSRQSKLSILEFCLTAQTCKLEIFIESTQLRECAFDKQKRDGCAHRDGATRHE